MNFKNHPKVRKARRGKVACLIAGVVMLLAAVACFFLRENIRVDRRFDKVAFAQAYNDEMLDEDIYVYIDITEEPYGIGSYGEARQFYYVADGYDLYIIECSESEYNEIAQQVKENGSYECIGTISKLDEEVIDLAIEVYNEDEDDPEEIINREDFDWYFQGVALSVHDITHAEGLLLFATLMLIVFGLITLIAGIVELSRFSSAFGRMSEMDQQLIAAELDSPQTVYVKQAHTYLTPRFIVSLGSRCAVIPYANIFWTYKFTQRYNFIPIYSNIQVFTSDFRTLGIAEMSLFTPKKKQAEMTIFNAIQYYNPQVRFGYTAENSNYFNALRFQQANSNYANNNVNNNAG
jgi:hypothetical protein